MIERFARKTSKYLREPAATLHRVCAKLQMEICLETFNVFQTNFAVYQHLNRNIELSGIFKVRRIRWLIFSHWIGEAFSPHDVVCEF